LFFTLAEAYVVAHNLLMSVVCVFQNNVEATIVDLKQVSGLGVAQMHFFKVFCSKCFKYIIFAICLFYDFLELVRFSLLDSSLKL